MTARIDNTHVSGGSGATAPVRVIAVDDHPLTRRGVAEELGEDARLEVLGTFPSFGAVPLPLRTPSQVKVAVIDLAVRHETRGVESVALVSSWGIPSVVYTMHGSAIIRDEALRAGALGFVSKSAAGGELVTAVLEEAGRHGVALEFPPPPEPTTCCGRGCNGCVWEGYYTALNGWREDARALLEAPAILADQVKNP